MRIVISNGSWEITSCRTRPSLAHNNICLWEHQVPFFSSLSFAQGTNSSYERLFQKNTSLPHFQRKKCWSLLLLKNMLMLWFFNCRCALSPHNPLPLEAGAPIVRLAQSLNSLGTLTAQSLSPYHTSSMGVWHYSCLCFKDPAQNLIARRPLTSAVGATTIKF